MATRSKEKAAARREGRVAKEQSDGDANNDLSAIEKNEDGTDKNAKQNKTFHALLDCFWKSGCSSFSSKNEMRFYYKRSIGLIEMVYDNSNLEQETKNMIWQAVKLLPLSNTQLIEVTNLLRGKVVKEMSWSVASKKQATEAIDMILHDMDESGVIGSKEGKHYEEILEGMNADNWWA